MTVTMGLVANVLRESDWSAAFQQSLGLLNSAQRDIWLVLNCNRVVKGHTTVEVIVVIHNLCLSPLGDRSAEIVPNFKVIDVDNELVKT